MLFSGILFCMKSTQKPHHIAFIMDGNRRWATQQGLPKIQGHTQGLENFKKIIKECQKQEIPYLTFWALSTENLQKRDALELKHLFVLLSQIRDFLHELVEYNARVRYIGDLSKLPAGLRNVLRDVAEKTEKHTAMTITLAINYGGHDELIRMAKKITASTKSSSQVSEKTINQVIDSGFLPSVDLIIRTGGHKRLSGFLPWIADYAELYFTDVMWPAFQPAQLKKALQWYSLQQRNFGK